MKIYQAIRTLLTIENRTEITDAINNMCKLEYDDNFELLKNVRDKWDDVNGEVYGGINNRLINVNKHKDKTIFKDGEVAEMFGVNISTIKRWRREGALTYQQKFSGGKVKISKQDLDDFVNNNPKYKDKWNIYR